MAAKEAKARIKINRLLEQAGWRFFDDENGKANILLENNAKLTQKTFDEFGEDFEKAKNGFIDFLLLDEKGFPFVVLEAKSEDFDPLDGKEQARRYAQSENCRFVILSNGNLHYLWDLERGNPSVIISFPTADSLKHIQSFKPSFKALADESVETDYIALTQLPGYQKDPRWHDANKKQDFVKEYGLKFLREYQLAAIRTLQESAKKGNDRYLFEMATGTGKTLISGAVIKLFLKTGNAKRILFLVDRLELEDQANKNFVRYLKNDYTTVIYKENRDDWRKAEIVVSTVQSLSFDNKYKKLFSPTDFDLIISDEAHRSITGNSRAVFEYFVGFKLGLTATPKDYLKNIDTARLNEQDPRAWERRQLLDTYKTFGCESGEPTFRYGLLDGVRDGFLINPVVADARTQITTQLLSDVGYSILKKGEENQDDEELTFTHKDFEKKLFSEKTNQSFCKVFLENALKDPISGEIGKTIVYCVSQRHASKIAQMLNQFAYQLWPDKYNSDFAVQVTSSVENAKQFTVNFSNNNLNGHTKWLEGYSSSKTRICVTVGMMTTGYDCEDLLNLCLMRPIFSPTDFIQIKGRGTRKFTFNYRETDGEVHNLQKEKYKIFDFFANCEYFEDKYDYDQILELPVEPSEPKDPLEPLPRKGDIILTQPDPVKVFVEIEIGAAGMKIDWKFFERFEQTVKGNPVIAEKIEAGDIEGAEEYVKKNIFDKPEDYFNLEKLRKSVKADRRISLREFIEKALGRLSFFKSKDELLEEEVEKFIAIYKPANQHILPIRNFLKAYITDTEIREIVESREFSRFATNPKVTQKDYKDLDEWREVIPEYVKDYVRINTYL